MTRIAGATFSFGDLDLEAAVRLPCGIRSATSRFST